MMTCGNLKAIKTICEAEAKLPATCMGMITSGLRVAWRCSA